MAALILAIVILGVAQALKYHSNQVAAIRSQDSINEIDGEVKLALLTSIKDFLRGEKCDAATLRDALNKIELSSGVQLRVLDGSFNPSPKLLGPKADRARQRCLRSTNTDGSIALDRAGGLYLCLTITPAQGRPAEQSILSMQPLFGEYLYFLRNIENGAKLRCGNLTAQSIASAFDELYFAFYWTKNEKSFHMATGITVAGR